MQSKIRNHSIIVSQKDGAIVGVILEKDWYVAEYFQYFDWHHRIEKPQGVFHVAGNNPEISLQQSNVFVNACLQGKIRIIDLRQFAITELIQGKARGKGK